MPPFHELVFIDEKSKNVKALRRLIDSSGHKNAIVLHGNANAELLALCNPSSWRDRRGVIFLDPFGMSVDWHTLTTISKTQALDLWLLYPLAGTVRNLPRRADRLDAVKRAAVRRQLGNDDWFEIFYRPQKMECSDLFGSASAPRLLREANADEIEEYFAGRLRELFPHVEKPKRLGPHNSPLFSLFFAVSNPAQGAIDLASRVARYILEK